MQHKKIEEYYAQQQSCDNLCDITDSLVEERGFMHCVTCPFCKEVVSAILTETTIACPSCLVEVNRE